MVRQTPVDLATPNPAFRLNKPNSISVEISFLMKMMLLKNFGKAATDINISLGAKAMEVKCYLFPKFIKLSFLYIWFETSGG